MRHARHRPAPTPAALTIALAALCAATLACGDLGLGSGDPAKDASDATASRRRLEISWTYDGPEPKAFALLRLSAGAKGTPRKLASVTAVDADLKQKGTTWTWLLERDASAELHEGDCVVVAAVGEGGVEGEKSPKACL